MVSVFTVSEVLADKSLALSKAFCREKYLEVLRFIYKML